MSDEKKLPTLAELHYDIDTAFKNDQLKLLLNQQPPEKWIKKNAMASNSLYLPIDKVEFLLDRIFQEWRIEVLREGTMFNSVYVAVRVHYVNPVNGLWNYHDGVGAKDMQKDANTTLSMDTIKSAAVQMALPTAKSLAIRDACDHLGKLFGRDLNRKSTIDFETAYSNTKNPIPKDSIESDRLIKVVESCKNRESLVKLKDKCISLAEKIAYDAQWQTLK